MADETRIPLGNVKALCPECGANLLVEHDGPEIKADDRVVCPTHGFVGKVEEVRSKMIENGRDKIVDHVRDQLREALKGAGLKPKR